jgi:hypothetical protein
MTRLRTTAALALFCFLGLTVTISGQALSADADAFAVRGTDGQSASGAQSGLDARFILGDKGVVIDKATGLEWLVGPDRDTTWVEAKAWVEQLETGGGGWRMPTRQELEGLYQEEFGTNNMNPLFRTTGGFAWTDEMVGKTHAWGFCFEIGSPYWPRITFSDTARAFAVRSRK